MSTGALIVEIDNREASLFYDTRTWRLTLKYLDSNEPIFEMSMDNVKKIYKSSSFQTTHTEQKNKLARTVIGGVMFGTTGAIIGAVSGEGTKQVVDAKYSCINIETNDGQEYVIICKENGILNSSWVFIQNLTDEILSKNDSGYQKRKKFGTVFGIICIAIIIAAIIICNIDM